MKCKPSVISKFRDNINDALNINLSGMIKCKHAQFPLVPATAITVYKSQSATFDCIIYNYDKLQH